MVLIPCLWYYVWLVWFWYVFLVNETLRLNGITCINKGWIKYVQFLCNYLVQLQAYLWFSHIILNDFCLGDTFVFARYCVMCYSLWVCVCVCSETRVVLHGNKEPLTNHKYAKLTCIMLQQVASIFQVFAVAESSRYLGVMYLSLSISFIDFSVPFHSNRIN